MIYHNPVLKGFYPDPSVCSYNGKYYMVCSSVSYTHLTLPTICSV